MCHAFNSTTKVYVGYNIYRIAPASYRALIDIAHPHRLHYACHDADEEVHLIYHRTNGGKTWIRQAVALPPQLHSNLTKISATPKASPAASLY